MAGRNWYSTLVLWVKIILPLVALGLMSTLFLFSGRPDPSEAIPFAQDDVTAMAEEQRLGRARFAGTLDDGRAVILSAERAAPVPGEPDRFTASDLEARLELDAYSFALLRAAEGVVDLATQVSTLSGGVLVTRSDGLRLETESLRFSLDHIEGEATQSVAVSGRGIDLTAGAMQIFETEDDQVLSFTGGVRVLYDPGR